VNCRRQILDEAKIICTTLLSFRRLGGEEDRDLPDHRKTRMASVALHRFLSPYEVVRPAARAGHDLFHEREAIGQDSKSAR
jgi:hypothetical protein